MESKKIVEFLNKQKDLIDEFLKDLSPQEKRQNHVYTVASNELLDKLTEETNIKWYDGLDPNKDSSLQYLLLDFEKEEEYVRPPYLDCYVSKEGIDSSYREVSNKEFLEVCKMYWQKEEKNITIEEIVSAQPMTKPVEGNPFIYEEKKFPVESLLINNKKCEPYKYKEIVKIKGNQKKVCIAVENSQNSKTGVVSATYMPIQSCPRTCPFLDKGCYAQTSHTGMKLVGLNKAAKERKLYKAIDLAIEEASQIDKLSGVNPLRLHIVGDCKTKEAVEVLSAAADRYWRKHNQPVWTYTHAWRNVPREAWGDISVLASCETLEECKQAMKRGYAAAVVRLKPFEDNIKWRGLNMIPCKEQTKGIKCKQCELCMNDEALLRTKSVICFFPHGAKAKQVKTEILKKEGMLKSVLR